jgi:ribose transport system substrate-binding protein
LNFSSNGGVALSAKAGTDIPKNIATDGAVVTKANADGLLWMQEQFLI